MSGGAAQGNSLPGEEALPVEAEIMNRRRITLPDGRYLIFYTFTPAPPEQERDNITKE